MMQITSPVVLPSLEVRWFLAGTGTELSRWWTTTLPDAESEAARTDLYLAFPGAPFVGVKLRAYEAKEDKPASLNLEFKLREQEHGVMDLTPRGGPQVPAGATAVSGVVERWRKWSVTVDQAAEDYLASTTGSRTGGIRVKKSRRLQKFRFDNHRLDPVPVSTRPEAGCGVELSELTPMIDGTGKPQVWLSLCFEAFSARPDADLTAILWRTVNHVFSVTALPRLNAEFSYSYPEWLVRLPSEKAG